MRLRLLSATVLYASVPVRSSWIPATYDFHHRGVLSDSWADDVGTDPEQPGCHAVEPLSGNHNGVILW